MKVVLITLLLVLACDAPDPIPPHQLSLDAEDRLKYSYGSGELNGPHTVLEISGRGGVKRSDHANGTTVVQELALPADTVGALFQHLLDLDLLEARSATSCCDQDFARIEGELDLLPVDVSVSPTRNAPAPVAALLDALQDFELKAYGERAK